MALPAGRYGVTKNQLLKIKKLPMNTIKLIEELTEKFNLLGSAAFKNSTSVVTQSTDMVESGAVYDALGFGNKNFLDVENYNSMSLSIVSILDNSTGKIYLTKSGETKYAGISYLAFDMFSESTKVKVSFDVIEGQTTTLGSIIGSRRKSDNVFVENISGSALTVGHHEKEFTVNSDLYLSFLVNGNTTAEGYLYLDNVMISYDGGAYEPYHASVSDSLEEKADNSIIGTVEGANASQAWSAGEHFIKDGQFKEVTQPIASGGAINESNTINKPIADCLVYKAGDSITGQFTCVGYLTGSAKEIFAVITLPREIIANGFNCTVNTITSRSIGGYLIPNASAFTNYKIKVKYIDGVKNQVVLVIANSDDSAFSGTNNTPATSVIDLTITFT